MKHQIHGEIAQYARMDFQQGGSAWVSRGSLMGYSPGVNWQLRIPGGIGGATRRSLSGEGMALVHVEAPTANQHVLVNANAPGHIIEWNLQNGPVLATRGAFLAAWGENISIDVAVAKRTGAALFGGVGLFLQRVSGTGTVLVHAHGDFIDVQLDVGERILVSTGNVAAFSADVDYDIQGVGGIRKALFGREGLFMTRLTGAGRVLLQSLKRGSAAE